MGNADDTIPGYNYGENLRHDGLVRVPTGFGSHIPPKPKKSILLAYVLALPPLGLLGGHHFYLGRAEFGVLYFFTLGLGGCGWFFDMFRIPLITRKTNKERYSTNPPREKTALDAYLLWGTPFGLLGFHHYYLGRWTWGVAYTFTLGLAGVGWLYDSCRMQSMIKEVSDRRLNRLRPVQNLNEIASEEERITLTDAYVLGISPFGVVGAHHYYMGRIFVGMVYTFSLGLLGIGWIVDWFNMPVLFKRSQHIRLDGDDGIHYLDDAYRLLWPFGFLGLHHFYLRQPGRGVLYLFTLGLLTVGWIADFVRLPRLVKDANKKLREERAHLEEIRDRLGPNARIVGDQRAYVAYATRDAFGGMTLPSPPTLGEGHEIDGQNVIQSTVQQAPPKHPGQTDRVTGSLPPLPTYNTALMTTIAEDDENRLNEGAYASLS